MNDSTLIIILILSIAAGISACIINDIFSVNSLNYVESQKLLRNDKNVILIDVRSRKEYLAGHITRAINIDYYNGFKKAIIKYPKDYIYVLYCERGFRSMLACRYMKMLGFKYVFNLKGGYLSTL